MGAPTCKPYPESDSTQTIFVKTLPCQKSRLPLDPAFKPNQIWGESSSGRRPSTPSSELGPGTCRTPSSHTGRSPPTPPLDKGRLGAGGGYMLLRSGQGTPAVGRDYGRVYHNPRCFSTPPGGSHHISPPVPRGCALSYLILAFGSAGVVPYVCTLLIVAVFLFLFCVGRYGIACLYSFLFYLFFA